MGKGMLFAAGVIGMLLLTLFFGELEERLYNPNQDPTSFTSGKATEVILERNKYGHYVVTGAINGEPVDFLLDTGATDVVIPASLAKRLGLHKGPAGTAMTANGPVTVYSTLIERLTIGDITLYKVNASINPAMDEGTLLGMSALKEIEFVQQDNLLTLRQINGPG